MDHMIEILDAQPVLSIRTKVHQTEIGDRVGQLMPRLMAVAGPLVAGAPLARWHGWEKDEGEMELAVPVRAPAGGGGDVHAAVLPAGRALVVMHVGPYDSLKDTWARIAPWMAEQGMTGRDAPWEEYIDDCATTPEAELRTRIVWPID